jgi:hypothetical protein
MSAKSTDHEPITVSNLRDQGVAAVEALTSSTQEAVSFAATRSKDALLSAAKETQRRVETVKDAAVERGAEVASKIKAFADEDLSDTLPGRMIGAVSDSVTNAADSLRGQDLRGLWNSTTEYARRNPAMFMAGVALTGFAIARFARATALRSETAIIADAAPRRTAPVAYTKTRSEAAP